MYQPPPQRIVHKRGANHGLHVFLSIITCGLWMVTGWPALLGIAAAVAYGSAGGVWGIAVNVVRMAVGHFTGGA